MGFYLLITLSDLVLFPKDFKMQEIPATILLLIGGATILYSNRKVKTLSGAKLHAYFFIAFLLIALTKINMVYYEYAEGEMFIYPFVLLFASLVIPWMPKEIFPVAAMVITANSMFYAYLNSPQMISKLPEPFNVGDYLEYMIFTVSVFVMCVIIRRKESERDMDNFILMISDVTGHGVSAALLVNRLHTEVEPLLKEGTEPGPLLKKLNTGILEDFKGTNMYISAFCGLLDFKKMKFIYSNHGHPPQYFYRIRESRIIPLDPQAALLGLLVSEPDAGERSIDFGKGDKILLFTDGVIEASNASGEEYGRVRLEEFMQKNHGLAPDTFNRELMGQLRAFRGEKFEDDIFILTIEIKK
ncbi:MAG: PP2C family protein-serine/threonine phosphatase [Candidatus Omnitrophica bacterium]|nr:PP2C family protein-serine/threonine phosphatase [Candidatus Omnitrophota bacterium]